MSDRVKVGTSKVTFRVRAFDYPISKRISRLYALWKVLRDAQKLARIFQCKNYATNEEGMWGSHE